ncbi:MAG: dUTP diphosphatase [Candidatus Paceibacterota bacterium]
MTPNIKVYALPGGHLPERQTDGAVGYDVYARAIVSASEMDQSNPNLRKTLFDFREVPKDPVVAKKVHMLNDRLVYRMEPGESVLVGIGFVTEMPYPLFYWVAPRSGLASKWGITVTNAPGTVDPDYRGEAGVLVYNRNETSFDLEHNMRIAQILFQWAIIPEITEVATFEDLGQTRRGTGGFGSTGLLTKIK